MLNLLVQGGPVVLILLALSVIAVTIIIAKTLQFAYLRLNSNSVEQDALAMWGRGQGREAIALLDKKSRRPVVNVIRTAMLGLLSDAKDATVREEVTRVAREQIETLRAWLKPLEVISNVSPLLGLFGTVLGMIEAFRKLEEAGNNVDPSILSGGIWQALLTTAVGLAVAIPAMLAHSWLYQRVEKVSHRMEDSATRIFTIGTRTEG